MTTFRATFTTAIDLRLWLTQNPKAVAILKKKILWSEEERNPLLDIAKKASENVNVNRTHFAMARVLLEEFDANVEARIKAVRSFPRQGGQIENEYTVDWLNEDEAGQIELSFKEQEDETGEMLEQDANGPGLLELTAGHCFPERLPFLRLLLENGAQSGREVSFEDGERFNAIEFAQSNGHLHAVEVLENKGNTRNQTNICGMTDRIRTKAHLKKLIRGTTKVLFQLEMEQVLYTKDRDEDKDTLREMDEFITEMEAEMEQIKVGMAEKKEKHQRAMAEMKEDPGYLPKKRLERVQGELKQVEDLVKAMKGIRDDGDGQTEAKVEDGAVAAQA